MVDDTNLRAEEVSPQITKSDELVFIPEQTNSVWPVQHMGIKDTVRFGRWLGTVVNEFFVVWSALSEDDNLASDSTAISSMVNAIFTVLPEDRIYELLGLVTGKDDAWIDEHFDLVDALNAIDEFITVNRLGEVRSAAGNIAVKIPKIVGMNPVR